MVIIHHFGILRQHAQEEIDKEKERIASGVYGDYATYREQVGYLNGIKAVLLMVDNIEQGLT